MNDSAHTSINFVFDLDGTVTNSFEAHKQAYSLAGFNGYTTAHFKMTAQDWGCSKELSEAKAARMSETSTLITVGPAYSIFQELPKKEILTGASPATVDACRDWIGKDAKVHCSASRTQKRKFLVERAKAGLVVYVDDDTEFLHRLESALQIPNLICVGAI